MNTKICTKCGIEKDITEFGKCNKNKDGKVNPETFEKIVKTFRDKYDVEFIFCKPNECGKAIIELLKKEGE